MENEDTNNFTVHLPSGRIVRMRDGVSGLWCLLWATLP